MVMMTIRSAVIYGGPFGITEAGEWLKLGPAMTRKVLRSLVGKGLLIPAVSGAEHEFKFMIADEAVRKNEIVDYFVQLRRFPASDPEIDDSFVQLRYYPASDPEIDDYFVQLCYFPASDSELDDYFVQLRYFPASDPEIDDYFVQLRYFPASNPELDD